MNESEYSKVMNFLDKEVSQPSSFMVTNSHKTSKRKETFYKMGESPTKDKEDVLNSRGFKSTSGGKFFNQTKSNSFKKSDNQPKVDANTMEEYQDIMEEFKSSSFKERVVAL